MKESGSTDVSTLQFERLTFFSDAVFAIAITLLVLDLHLPLEARDRLDIGPLIPKFIGFCISFAVIAIYWNAHHRLFGTLQRENGPLRVVNFLFLGSIVFLPFPTSVMAEFNRAADPMIFYALATSLVGVFLLLLTLVARRPHLMRPEETRGGTWRLLILCLPAPVLFLISIPIARVSPNGALVCWVMVWPVAALLDLAGKRLQGHLDAKPSSSRS